jgi:uncharacterized membrane protein
MLQVITSLAGSPQQLHAILVHLPIAAAMIGLLMLLTLACSGGRSAGIRWTLVLVYLLGAGAGFLAGESGEQAAAQLRYPLVEAAQATLREHEKLAEPIWVGMLVMAVLVMCTATSSAGLRATVLTLATIVGLALTTWVGVTAHHGGQLVYRYGVGVPATPDNLQTPASRPRPPTTPVERPSAPEPPKPDAPAPWDPLPLEPDDRPGPTPPTHQANPV